MMGASAVLDILKQTVPNAAVEELPSCDMPTIAADREHLVAVCEALRDRPELQFALLADLTAADRLPAEPRFEVVYHLACVGEAYAHADGAAPPRRLRLKVRVPADDRRLPSVTPVWAAAGWLEREVFDMFGLRFDGHGDLRRVLMPDDWEGHPLLKDYPVQIRKDAASGSPLQLSAEEFAANVRARLELGKSDPRGGQDDSGHE
jgi:NADH-quinone oxidoreductase subunit C